MQRIVEDSLEFLFRTVGGAFILVMLAVLVVLAVFWPGAEVEPLPWLGFMGTDVTAKTVQQYRLPFNKGVLIERVFNNSPADFSNLASGDFIVKFNNRIVFSEDQLRDMIFDMDPEEKTWMTVYRDGSYYNVTLKLALRPTDRSVPAEAVAFSPAAGGANPFMTSQAGGTQVLGVAPPITADAPLPHTYRGVCSNCHVIVSRRQAAQPNTQLVAGMKPWRGFLPARPRMPFPPGSQPGTGQNLPGAFRTSPLEEFVWAGIGVETYNPREAASFGVAPNVAGVVVDDVMRGSRGGLAGVLSGDLIREVNGMEVYDVDSFANLVTAQQLTGAVLLISRAGETIFVTVPER